MESIDPAEFVQDPTFEEAQQEPMLFDGILEKMFDYNQNANIKTHHPKVAIKESNNTTVWIPLPETQSNERPMNEDDEVFTVVGHTLPTPTQVGHSADYIEVPPHIKAACTPQKERIHPRYNFRKGDRMTTVRTQCRKQKAELNFTLSQMRKNAKKATTEIVILEWKPTIAIMTHTHKIKKTLITTMIVKQVLQTERQFHYR